MYKYQQLYEVVLVQPNGMGESHDVVRRVWLEFPSREELRHVLVNSFELYDNSGPEKSFIRPVFCQGRHVSRVYQSSDYTFVYDYEGDVNDYPY